MSLLRMPEDLGMRTGHRCPLLCVLLFEAACTCVQHACLELWTCALGTSTFSWVCSKMDRHAGLRALVWRRYHHMPAACLP